jgi:hypothetical protein
MGPAARWCLTVGLLAESAPLPTAEDFARETDVIVQEGLAPVAHHALRVRDAHADSRFGETFHQISLLSEMRAMAADAAGARFLMELTAAGIPTAVVKGPSMARLHPAGWPRSYADIDVLVEMGDFAPAVGLAVANGFTHSERSVPQWNWFDVVCREGINLHSASGGNIDLHHHLPPWALGSSVVVATVINRAQKYRLCMAPVSFATPEDQLLVVTLHIVNDLWKGKMGLASWRDFVVLAHLLGPEATQQAFLEVGLGWFHGLVTAELARRVPEADVRPPMPVVALPPRARLRIAALGWSKDSSHSRHRLAWAARLPVPQAIAFLAGAAVPSGRYIHSRHGTFRNYWMSGWRETVQLAQGRDYRMTTVEDYQDEEAAEAAEAV